MLRLRHLSTAVIVAAVTLLALAGPAAAHAVLLSTTPADSEVLESPPSEVVLGFSESIAISPGAVVVIDPRGEELGGVEVAAVDSELVATLPELTVDGSYTVGWRVISEDSHPVTGAFLFHLRDETLLEPVAIEFGGSGLGADVLRALGISVALGGGVFVALALLARRPRPWVPWLVVVAGAGSVLVGSAIGVGGSVGESFSVLADTTTGSMATAAVLVAMAGLVASLTVPWWQAHAVLLFGTVALVGLSGHAVSLPPVARSAPLTVLHVMAAVVWLVALLRLVRLIGNGRDRTGPARKGVASTTPWAVSSVVVLAGTGTVLVLDRVPLDELLSSWYGRLSVAKTALLLGAVVLAALNRFRYAPRLTSGDETARGAAVVALRRSVRIEVLVVALALVAGSAVAQIAPPGVAAADLVIERTTFGDGEVELSVEPLRRGTNEVHVIALGDDGRLMADLEDLRVEMYLPERDLGPIEPEILPVTGGHIVSYADVPLNGDWEFVVLARVGRFEELRAVFEVPVEN